MNGDWWSCPPVLKGGWLGKFARNGGLVRWENHRSKLVFHCYVRFPQGFSINTGLSVNFEPYSCTWLFVDECPQSLVPKRLKSSLVNPSSMLACHLPCFSFYMFLRVFRNDPYIGILMNVCWLVVWLPFFIFPYIGFLIIPIDVHTFQRGGLTTNQFVTFVLLKAYLAAAIIFEWPRAPREDELDQVEKSSGGRGRKILEKAGCTYFFLASVDH